MLRTLLLNPRLGRAGIEELKAIVDSGHDLGLHGGGNHGKWQHCAHAWSAKTVEREVNWGMEEMLKLGLPKPLLFSSPGFNSPPKLASILGALGLKGVTDEHAWLLDAGPQRVDNIWSFGTGLVAEPGGVGFFENRHALGESPSEHYQFVLNILRNSGESMMVYDHPALMVDKGLQYLSACIDAARDSGYVIQPLSKALP